ncbi:hypothetical protein HELRODRAFT_194048 [Helobdella robusta]|uniref:Treslin STD domain-containing protein n=1 Tax=Helobdella robusta TaxID=6412 RepID=T1FVM1_HELRO|nr:hypothetical protein HELRODRAFT_194048 [Helobdella robusta]ESN93522.1 hypothetical protein HELRODRAFT_194048 [Helobdella robusta]
MPYLASEEDQIHLDQVGEEEEWVALEGALKRCMQFSLSKDLFTSHLQKATLSNQVLSSLQQIITNPKSSTLTNDPELDNSSVSRVYNVNEVSSNETDIIQSSSISRQCIINNKNEETQQQCDHLVEGLCTVSNYAIPLSWKQSAIFMAVINQKCKDYKTDMGLYSQLLSLLAHINKNLVKILELDNNLAIFEPLTTSVGVVVLLKQAFNSPMKEYLMCNQGKFHMQKRTFDIIWEKVMSNKESAMKTANLNTELSTSPDNETAPTISTESESNPAKISAELYKNESETLVEGLTPLECLKKSPNILSKFIKDTKKVRSPKISGHFPSRKSSPNQKTSLRIYNKNKLMSDNKERNKQQKYSNDFYNNLESHNKITSMETTNTNYSNSADNFSNDVVPGCSSNANDINIGGEVVNATTNTDVVNVNVNSSHGNKRDVLVEADVPSLTRSSKRSLQCLESGAVATPPSKKRRKLTCFSSQTQSTVSQISTVVSKREYGKVLMPSSFNSDNNNNNITISNNSKYTNNKTSNNNKVSSNNRTNNIKTTQKPSLIRQNSISTRAQLILEKSKETLKNIVISAIDDENSNSNYSFLIGGSGSFSNNNNTTTNNNNNYNNINDASISSSANNTFNNSLHGTGINNSSSVGHSFNSSFSNDNNDCSGNINMNNNDNNMNNSGNNNNMNNNSYNAGNASFNLSFNSSNDRKGSPSKSYSLNGTVLYSVDKLAADDGEDDNEEGNVLIGNDTSSGSNCIHKLNNTDGTSCKVIKDLKSEDDLASHIKSIYAKVIDGEATSIAGAKNIVNDVMSYFSGKLILGDRCDNPKELLTFMSANDILISAKTLKSKFHSNNNTNKDCEIVSILRMISFKEDTTYISNFLNNVLFENYRFSSPNLLYKIYDSLIQPIPHQLRYLMSPDKLDDAFFDLPNLLTSGLSQEQKNKISESNDNSLISQNDNESLLSNDKTTKDKSILLDRPMKISSSTLSRGISFSQAPKMRIEITKPKAELRSEFDTSAGFRRSERIASASKMKANLFEASVKPEAMKIKRLLFGDVKEKTPRKTPSKMKPETLKVKRALFGTPKDKTPRKTPTKTPNKTPKKTPLKRVLSHHVVKTRLVKETPDAKKGVSRLLQRRQLPAAAASTAAAARSVSIAAAPLSPWDESKWSIEETPMKDDEKRSSAINDTSLTFFSQPVRRSNSLERRNSFYSNKMTSTAGTSLLTSSSSSSIASRNVLRYTNLEKRLTEMMESSSGINNNNNNNNNMSYNKNNDDDGGRGFTNFVITSPVRRVSARLLFSSAASPSP